MRVTLGTWARSGIAVAVTALGVAVGVRVAGAHVSIMPNQSPANAYELYTVRVPTEKAVPTVKVRLDFPEGMDVSRFASAPGWTREVGRDGGGRITSVTWTGGSIASDEIGIFQFQARNGASPGKLAVRATQTYEDGSEVEWANPAEPNPAPTVTLTGPLLGAADLTRAASVGQVVAAIAYLDGIGFHGIDTAIAGGEIPAGTLGKVQKSIAVTAAAAWPTALQPGARELVDHLRALAAAVEAGDVSAAVDPAAAAHDVEHDLSSKAYAWLREAGGGTAGASAGAGH